MIKVIAINEIRAALRNQTVLLLGIIFWLLIAVATLGGFKNYSTTDQNRKQAKAMFRKEWIAQQAHPHSAAHFGTYLFKPFSLISLFDTGLNNYTGTSYRVEAHHQTEMNYAAAQDSDTEMRFGELTMASLLQLFLPLLIIFICFQSVSKERENHTLKLLYAQGLKSSSLLWGKIIGNYLLVAFITVPAFLMMLLTVGLKEPALLAHTLVFSISYLLYFLILVSIFVFVSALSKSSKNALLTSLGLWVFFCIMLPKIVVGLANNWYALPSRAEFNKAIEVGTKNGIDGDKDRMGRYQDYLKQTLAKYKVDSLSQLPINFGGLSMQNGEDYLTKVYFSYAKAVEKKIGQQQFIQQLAAFVDPFLGIQQVSMAYAGTDYHHHIDFHQHAQRYRDELIRKLNNKMAYDDINPKAEYKLGPDFFKTIKDFEYQQPSLSWAIQKQQYAFYALCLWLLLTLSIVPFVSKKIALN